MNVSSHPLRYRRPARWIARAGLASTLSTLLVLSMATSPVRAAAVAAPPELPATAQVPDADVTDAPIKGDPWTPQEAAAPLPEPVWPAAASADIAVPRAGQRKAAKVATAAVPVRVDQPGAGSTAPTRVKVDVLDRATTQKAGVQGLLLTVTDASAISGATARAAASDGKVDVTVDYSAFAGAYGGDWASRLRLVSMPECALSTPGRTECAGTPLLTKNDGAAVSATVATTARPALLAVTAAASGSGGDFSATALSASATWSAGGNAGGFNWSYPMRVPPTAGGLQPRMALSYSSQSVDGRNAAVNNQTSWIGAGFDGWPGGYIERRYKPCGEDMTGGNNKTKSGDMCFGTWNATLAMDSTGGELIYNATEKRWHVRGDDGSRVERKVGRDNPDEGNDGADGDKGEYWVVTTSDGTQYWFGAHKLPGWSAGDPVTNSVWTVPVFGNQSGEPCNKTAFADSYCSQAWRWNLDYVVDVNGNSISYWYGTESNKYARNNTGADDTAYVRSGYVKEIAFGTRTVNGVDSVLDTPAPAKTVLQTADRCVTTTCATHNGTNWPDTPWDQECAGSTCVLNSPTFWTSKRLSTVTTTIRNGANYDDVEQWTLGHTFFDPGDGNTSRPLWLEKISHKGLIGDDVTLPDVTFRGLSLSNRVDDLKDGLLAMAWPRLVRIDTESGGSIAVDYSNAVGKCVDGGAKPDPENNQSMCYPVRYIPSSSTTIRTDWFHKYVVDDIYESDNIAGVTTKYHYDYLDKPAWHYTDDDGLTKSGYQSWSVWRGFGEVAVTTGQHAVQTYTKTLYFRGMHGDKKGTGTRSASVKDSTGATQVDEDWFAGMPLESITRNGPGGPEISGSINTPWASAPTASRTINGDTVAARFTRIASTTSRVKRDGGRPDLVSKVNTSFDGYGMPTQTDDAGEDGVAGDERCSKTTYEPRNTTTWITGLSHRTQEFAVSCFAAATPSTLTTADVISDDRTFYDDAGTHGTAPRLGNVTRTEELSAWSTAGPSYAFTSASTYDAIGRLKTTTDANNYSATNDYTPADGGLTTGTTITNALGHVAKSTFAPAYGLATSSEDANNKVTSMTYDALGRLKTVRKPGADVDDIQYTYEINRDKPNVVTTSELGPNGNRITTYTLYDGLNRPLQTQEASPGPGGGRILTNTFYDDAGRAYESYGAYWDAAAPGKTLVVPVEPKNIADQTRTVFDGAGRTQASIFEPYNVERWRTSSVFGGDRTDVIPPEGGTATSTYVDSRGRTKELRQYARTASRDSGTITSYSYDRKGQLTEVKDPAGNKWTNVYDIRGRKTSDTDPDRGTTSYTYTAGGQIQTTTDSRGTRLYFGYDALDRKTAVRQTRVSGALLASWTYDTLAKGHLTSSTRNTLGNSALTYTNEILEYDDSYQPRKTKLDITGETGLTNTGGFQNSYTYYPDGSLDTMGYAQIDGGDLKAEAVQYTYNDLGMPTSLRTTYGADTFSLVPEVTYNALGQGTKYNLCTTDCTKSGNTTYLQYAYEFETGRLAQSFVGRDVAAPYNIADVHYTYDPAGNISKIQDIIETSAESQCFNYDHLQQLKHAWTPAGGDCAAEPTTAGLGGPAPYWQSWDYDTVGNRTGQVDHKTSGDVTTTYTYPAVGAAKPHTLSSTTTGATTASYAYDATGNTTARPSANGPQTLTWDLEGHLAGTGDATGSTSYVYHPDGARLIRRDPGAKTLYMPGQELRYATGSGSKTTTRYYTFAGMTIASRNTIGLTWLSADHQGTAKVSIDTTTNGVTQRRQTPFGQPRGTNATWPNQKGFVGGTTDPTGMVHLGAREYDPGIGRFISVDPILDTSSPQQMQGYNYANNSPITFGDPDGLEPRPWHASNWGSLPAAQRESISRAYLDGERRVWAYVAQKKAAEQIEAQDRQKQKSCNWWCRNGSKVVGAGVGIAVGIGCGALLAPSGIGLLACGAAAGAAGSFVTGWMDGQRGWDLAGSTAIGAAAGAAGGWVLGKVAGALAPKLAPLARSLASKLAGPAAAVKGASNKVLGSAIGLVKGAATRAGVGSGAPRRVFPGGRVDGQTAIAGHSIHHPPDGNFNVPSGTSLATYAPYGKPITNIDGYAVESGKGWPAVVKTYGENEGMPNYTVYPPTGLIIREGSITVTEPTLLSDILKPNMGLCHFAACNIIG